jgi:hypothetical protein
MSYNGHLGFGLLGDYDALPDLDAIALDLEHSIRLLARTARVPGGRTGKAAPAKKAARAAKAKAPAKAQARARPVKAAPLKP